MTDEQILQAYRDYDEKFRAEKKRGNYKRATEWKTKRDALEAEVSRIHKDKAGK